MPNRIIKESICRSDSIDSLSWFEEVLFYRLIVVCDDYGRFDGRAAIIRGACFPLKDIRLEQIEDALKRLAIAGMIRRYETEDGAFLQLTAWGKHQQIRAKNSKYPAPNEECNQLPRDNTKNNHEIERDTNGNHLISDDCKCSRESKYENREAESRCVNARATGEVGHFEEFWESYPSEKRRYLAEKAYCDLVVSGSCTEEDLAIAAKNYAAHIRETGSKAFFPNNFLEKHVFEDYLETRQLESGNMGDVEPEEELVDESVDDEEWWKYGLNAREG